VVVAETNRVAEYDLKTGKDVWKYDVQTPTCVQRLANGNTLIATTINPRRVMEVDPAGEVVWEHRSTDGFAIIRAYRR
jgi:outer membrane protein assembly factor BamB